MQKQIPLCSNTADGGVSGSERLVNVYPEQALGGKYQFKLVRAEGQAFYCELPTYPLKAMYELNGKAFAVTSSRFYTIAKGGTYTDKGAVNLNGIVSIASNGLQVVMVDGSKGYYYDIATGVVTQLLTANGFYPARTVTYQDGYFIFDRVGTGQFYISELLDVAFDPLDFATAEGQPDNLLAVLSDHREIFMFGSRSIEVWYNSGASDFPLERNQGAFIEKGTAAPYSVAKQNNTVYFVGSDLMVYQMAGYTPQRISTHAVEKDLKNKDLQDCYAYTYQESGHLFYVLTIPSANITWAYDIATQSWHIKKSYQFGRHNVSCAMFFDNKTLVGDFQNGRIYQFTNNYYKDDQDLIECEFIIPTVNSGRRFLTVSSLELDMNTGVGLNEGYGSDPEMRVYYSKDNGLTWGDNYKVGKIGRIGEYFTRCKVNRFGCARQFTFKFRTTDPIPLEIGGAWIEAR